MGLMSLHPGDEDRQWAREKRDFVADAREETADQRDAMADARDAVADVREQIADVRESHLDEWEHQLAMRAAALGLAFGPSLGAPEEDGSRVSAREERGTASHRREREKKEREAASRRRAADARPTLLAVAFAEIAEQLYDAETYEEVLARIAEAAVTTVTGGQLASVTLREAGGYRTAGATAEQASAVDQAQYDADEGPSLDALNVPLVDAPSFPDDRWPRLGAQPVEHGVESSVSYRLGAVSGGDSEDDSLGSLNIYALSAGAFDQTALEIGSILAAHASLAARAVGERTSLDALGHHLERALLSRDVIGQAKGILMERPRITLRRPSTSCGARHNG
jgi:hypothetical protein